MTGAESQFDWGVPRSLRRVWPKAGRWELRLGDVPLLAERCPHLMEREVPAKEVRAAAEILGKGCPAARRPRGNVSELEAAQEAVARAMAAGIPAEDDGGAPSGLGWWLQLYHFALAALHLGREEAMQTPVGELMALRSAHWAGFGGKFTGPAFEERDLLEELETAESENV